MTVHVSLTSASIRNRDLIRRFYVFKDGNEVGILTTTNKVFTEFQPRKEASEALRNLSAAEWQELANG